jgi:hypothetical protein
MAEDKNMRDNTRPNRLSPAMHSLPCLKIESPFLLACAVIALLPCSLVSAETRQTENVILITTDGLRWEEVFSGADLQLMNRTNGGVGNTNALAKAFWRETPEARREALMPFLWKVIAKQGQIYGNQNKGSVARITNDKRFSYPGYNEILTGFANPEIKSNNKVPNQTPTVLEWLHQKPAFSNSVAAFSAWDVTPFIINRERCGFPVMGGWESVPRQLSNPRMELLNELIRDTTPANKAEVYDSFIFQAAREYLITHRPRVLFVGFLETDHWAHAGRYDNTLETAHKFDDYVRRLWDTCQSLDQYRGKTTFILTTDHGRGVAPENWKHHGAKIDGAENIWMAFLGPDTQALGERSACDPVTQSQVAATLAAFLGEDYRKSVAQADPAVQSALPVSAK